MTATETLTAPIEGRRVLYRLLREKGLESRFYTLFFVVGEATFVEARGLPEPIEDASGFVLLSTGEVYSFCMEWDPDHHRPALSEWERVDPEPYWTEVPEYQLARQRLGLPAA